ncbi:MAG TPA: hypothetical protein VF981_16550 [Gemmatimonadaceae bacterium]
MIRDDVQTMPRHLHQQGPNDAYRWMQVDRTRRTICGTERCIDDRPQPEDVQAMERRLLSLRRAR